MEREELDQIPWSQLAVDADVFGPTNVCAPDHTAPVLKTLRCFGGTLGDGNVIVFGRD